MLVLALLVRLSPALLVRLTAALPVRLSPALPVRLSPESLVRGSACLPERVCVHALIVLRFFQWLPFR